MGRIRMLSLSVLVCCASTASADMGGRTPEPKQTSSTPEAGTTALTPRQQADRWYGDAYDEIAKAKKDVAAKKDKNVEKRFKKALERAERAIEIDSTYHEAWNLVGYAARHLKDYDHAVSAYTRCLRLKYDYAPAREYLGEAYVELGQLDKAREQLAVLERLEAKTETEELKATIDAYAAAHPETAAAPADSASTKP